MIKEGEVQPPQRNKHKILQLTCNFLQICHFSLSEGPPNT